MSEISIGTGPKIDLAKLIDTRLLVQANSGGGKSWLIRRLLEQSHGQVQQIIIDLEGEFSTLREKYDYILAGKGGDTAAEPRSAALLAKRLLELNVSAIIDLYELNHQDRKKFVRLFLSAMVNAPKNLWHPCIVVIDEAHVFAPQSGSSEAMEAVIDLATRGRKRGYCAVLATQRISKLHKDAVAEMNNKLIGRTGLDIDRKRAAEELGFTTKEDALSLRTLAPGTFFAFGPAISDEVVEVTVGSVNTTHPKSGDRILTHVTPPPEKIKALLSQLSDLPQEAEEEAQTLEQLKANNVALTRKVQVLERQKAAEPVQPKPEVKTVTVVDTGHYNTLRRIADMANKALNEQNHTVPVPKMSYREGATSEPVSIDAKLYEVPVEKKINGGAQRMLNVLGSRFPMSFTKSQLALLSNMSPKSGTYSNYLSILRQKGFLDEESGLISLSEIGLESLGVDKPAPQSQEELLAMWESNLTGGAKRIYTYLVGEYPRSASKQEIAEMTEMSAGSGTFSNYLSILRRNGLIESDGTNIKANSNLFVKE